MFPYTTEKSIHRTSPALLEPTREDGSLFLNSIHLNGIRLVWYWHNTSDAGLVYIVYQCKMLYIP